MKKIVCVWAFLLAFSCPAWAAMNFFGGHEKKEDAPAAQKAEPASVEPAAYEEPVEPVEAAETPVEPVKETFAEAPKKIETPSKDKAKVQKTEVVASPAAEPEVAVKLKAIQTQETRVAALRKQLDGEISQLNEMRKSFSEAFGVNAKKLEEGAYHFDAKSGKLVEK